MPKCSRLLVAIALLAVVTPVLASTKESIQLDFDRRGPLAMLANTTEVKQNFGDINVANLLGSVYDVRGKFLSPSTIKSLVYPLFVKRDAKPSGKSARAILDAENAVGIPKVLVTVKAVKVVSKISPKLAEPIPERQSPPAKTPQVVVSGNPVVGELVLDPLPKQGGVEELVIRLFLWASIALVAGLAFLVFLLRVLPQQKARRLMRSLESGTIEYNRYPLITPLSGVRWGGARSATCSPRREEKSGEVLSEPTHHYFIGPGPFRGAGKHRNESPTPRRQRRTDR